MSRAAREFERVFFSTFYRPALHKFILGLRVWGVRVMGFWAFLGFLTTFTVPGVPYQWIMGNQM